MSRPLLDRPLTFLHAARNPRCLAVVDKHFQNYATLQFMEAGSLRLSYDDAAHRLEGAWFWFAMPGPRIRFTTAEGRPWSHRYVAFHGPLMNAWRLHKLIHRQPVRCPPGEKTRFAWLMDEILDRLGGNDRWAHLQAVNLLENLLIEIEGLRQPRSGEGQKARLARLVREAWEAAPALPVDYAALARRSGFALSTFRRHFCAETGVALHRFVIGLRIEHARRLLFGSEMTTEEIAEASGFADVFYFTRCFKAAVGVPPAHYRRTRLSSGSLGISGIAGSSCAGAVPLRFHRA